MLYSQTFKILWIIKKKKVHLAIIYSHVLKVNLVGANFIIRHLPMHKTQCTIIQCIVMHVQGPMHKIPCMRSHAQDPMHEIPCKRSHARDPMQEIPCTRSHAWEPMYEIPHKRAWGIKLLFILHSKHCYYPQLLLCEIYWAYRCIDNALFSQIWL